MFEKLIRHANAAYPDDDYTFVKETVYSRLNTQSEQQLFLHLLRFARSLQHEDPTFENTYYDLLNLFVLNGSRIDALKTIDRRIYGIHSGTCSMVSIAGVSGIGKTSLAMVFRERAFQAGAEFVVARCIEQESTAYALWQSVAYSIASEVDISLDSLSAPIGSGKQALSLQHLIQQFSGWLSSNSKVKPVVILLDDLHWIDVDSLYLLVHLMRQTVEAKILFLVTYRSEETHRGHPLYEYLPQLQRLRSFESIELEPLKQDDIARLVSAYHGDCSPQLANYLLDRAEGHPLFTWELLHNLIEQNLIEQDNAGYWLPPQESVPVPKLLSQLITQRVSRLGDHVEKLLSIAAIVGEVWYLQIVEQLLDMSEDSLLEVVETALGAELISVEHDLDETYKFTHGLIKQVLYEQQIVRRRKRYHAQIAEQFENLFPSDIFAIAHHYFEAEQWGKVIPYSSFAAEQMSQDFATKSSLQLYQQVLIAAEHMGNKVEPEVVISTYENLGRRYLTLESRKEAEDAFDRMRDIAHQSGNLDMEGRALSHLAMLNVTLYEFERAEEYALTALEISNQTGNLQVSARSLLSLGRLKLMDANFGDAEENLQQAIQYSDSKTDLATLTESYRYATYRMVWNGNYIEGESRARKALEHAQQMHDIFLIANGYQILSYVLIELGQYVEAHQSIQAILHLGQEFDAHIHKLSRILNQMGYLYLEIGDAEQALVWDMQAVSSIKHTDDLAYYEMQRYSLLNVVSDLIHLNRIKEALDYVQKFESVTKGANYIRFRYYNRFLLLMAELNLAQGTNKQAIEYALQARSVAEDHENPKNLAKSYWFEGKVLRSLRKFNDAIKQLTIAIEIVDHIQHGSLRWKIRLSLAETLVSAGQSPAIVLQEARSLMDELRNQLAQSELLQSFVTSKWMVQLEKLEDNPAPQKLAYPAGLTKREVEVLQLVARGATNQEIADTLFIGLRTVHTHVRNILNKTNCDNRTAATAFAIEHHIVST